MAELDMLADRGSCDQLRETIRTNRGNLDFRAGALEALECLHFDLTEMAETAAGEGKKEAQAAFLKAAALVGSYYRGTPRP